MNNNKEMRFAYCVLVKGMNIWNVGIRYSPSLSLSELHTLDIEATHPHRDSDIFVVIPSVLFSLIHDIVSDSCVSFRTTYSRELVLKLVR